VGNLDLAALLRRRRTPRSFRSDPVDPQVMKAVLDAGGRVPLVDPGCWRPVLLEERVSREALLASLRAAGSAEAAVELLGAAPALVANCEAGDGGAGRAASWMAAAQMALAAEESGYSTLAVRAGTEVRPPAGLGLPAAWRVEAVLAIGAAQEAQAARPDLTEGRGDGPPAAADPSRGAVSADRRVLLSFMEIAAATAGAEDLDGVLETIARALGRLFPVDGAALGLLEDGSVVVREILRSGATVRRDPERLPADGSHLMSWAIRRGRPLWRNDVPSELRFAESLPASGLRSDMVIPLRARGELIGAFLVGSRRRHAFDREDFEVLQRCSDMTAVAVETQRLLLATRRLSETDGVTGVFNHRHFATLIRQEVERARRLDRPVALLMIDIDNFKRFNDTYGHQAGDEVLRHVAQLVARLLRRSDVVARYGGEEFAAILQDAAADGASPVAEKIRQEVEKSALALPGLPRHLRVTVSIGLASFPADARNATELVGAADRGLYRAKRTGKNRVCPAGTEGA
jgi:diguanylate cyclase (GGDEF)-like protein